MLEIKDKETLIECLKYWVWKVENSPYGVTFPSAIEKTWRSGDMMMRQRLFSDETDCCLHRFVTRMVFVWAMVKRGDIDAELFEEEGMKDVINGLTFNNLYDGRYYNAILQNLFFGVIYHSEDVSPRVFATKIGARDNKTYLRYGEMFSISEDEVLRMFGKVPSNAHPVFACRDKERADGGMPLHTDGFSRETEPTQRAFVPNYVLFAEEDSYMGLIPLLRCIKMDAEEIWKTGEELWEMLAEREKKERE